MPGAMADAGGFIGDGAGMVGGVVMDGVQGMPGAMADAGGFIGDGAGMVGGTMMDGAQAIRRMLMHGRAPAAINVVGAGPVFFCLDVITREAAQPLDQACASS